VLCTAEQDEAGGARVCGGCGGEDGVQGGRRGIYKAAGSNLGSRAERGDHGRDLGVAGERAEEAGKKELQVGQGCQWEEATVLRPRAGSGRPWSGVAASGPGRAGCGALRAAVACRVLGRARMGGPWLDRARSLGRASLAWVGPFGG